MPITVAARSKALTVFVRSNVGIVGSNHTQIMDPDLGSNPGRRGRMSVTNRLTYRTA
jgi:hypothetical protein